MNRIEEHVNRLFADLPESERKEQLRREIIQNLTEKVDDLMAAGKAEEDAVNKAIVEFGGIEEIREELCEREAPEGGNHAGLALGFSLWGTALIVGLMLFINLYYSPGVVWCVYPIFAVLWWPLGVFYHWLRVRRKRG